MNSTFDQCHMVQATVLLSVQSALNTQPLQMSSTLSQASPTLCALLPRDVMHAAKTSYNIFNYYHISGQN